ncbi:MAG: hypothetical protein AVDCRST_MAG59-3709 [uncultured Thermomicrobiales bacterium]|uniref:Uncharacterized protein n=1 Tax=uncultured Thermomicrobiales bacterium TaxID=1645740 RepID=A0A6J4V9J1_9BACT|nr:MAG: hypothetical protein AVDCRST_MAG59-3709 [uncultured Thermomicrobiales bacterium]
MPARGQRGGGAARATRPTDRREPQVDRGGGVRPPLGDQQRLSRRQAARDEQPLAPAPRRVLRAGLGPEADACDGSGGVAHRNAVRPTGHPKNAAGGDLHHYLRVYRRTQASGMAWEDPLVQATCEAWNGVASVAG